MFIHFSINTFTDKEWGYGDESPSLFNPSELDCRQWAKVARDAGMKGIVITAKHHDGFCLWPSQYTGHSVKNSPWRNGNGDLLRGLRQACDEYGLKLGIYLSPWDRNSSVYGTPEYLTYYRNQLRELLTNYGDIFEVWFDGANGGDPETYWAPHDNVTSAELTIDLGGEIEVNRILIQEYIPLGQRIKKFSILAWTGNEWSKVTEGTTAGYKIIRKFPVIRTSRIQLRIEESKDCPVISNIELYRAPGE